MNLESNEPNVESPLQPDTNIQPIDPLNAPPNEQADQVNTQMHSMFTKLKGGGMKKNSKQFSSAGFNMILIIDNATVFGDYYRVQNKEFTIAHHRLPIIYKNRMDQSVLAIVRKPLGMVNGSP